MSASSHNMLVNALTADVGTGTYFSGLPTNQELTTSLVFFPASRLRRRATMGKKRAMAAALGRSQPAVSSGFAVKMGPQWGASSHYSDNRS